MRDQAQPGRPPGAAADSARRLPLDLQCPLPIQDLRSGSPASPAGVDATRPSDGSADPQAASGSDLPRSHGRSSEGLPRLRSKCTCPAETGESGQNVERRTPRIRHREKRARPETFLGPRRRPPSAPRFGVRPRSWHRYSHAHHPLRANYGIARRNGACARNHCCAYSRCPNFQRLFSQDTYHCGRNSDEARASSLGHATSRAPSPGVLGTPWGCYHCSSGVTNPVAERITPCDNPVAERITPCPRVD